MTVEILSAEIVRKVRESMGDSPHNQACSVAAMIREHVEEQKRSAELAAFRKFGNECLRNIYDLEREKPHEQTT